MNGHGKSDGPIVPEKCANKALGTPDVAECMEGRGPAKGNSVWHTRQWTQSHASLPQELERMRQTAIGDCAFDPRQEPYVVVPLVRICAGGVG